MNPNTQNRIKHYVLWMCLPIFFVCMVSVHPLSASQDFSLTLDSARQGDTDAMCETGMAYYHGKGTLKDPFKAKCWIQKAYHLGSGRAKEIWNTLELWEYSGKCDLIFDDAPRPEHGRGDIYTEPVTGMRFVWVPKTCFKMGCNSDTQKCKKNEKPVHKVCLDGFWMAAFETGQILWTTVMGSNPSRFSGQLNHPVENVSFQEVETFISKLNAGIYNPPGKRFSLPTEAQWESACRNGGRPVVYPWKGDGFRPDANCGNCDNKGFNARTAPVGSFSPNDLGLYDMGGNVKEWCKDVYNKNAYFEHKKNNPEFQKKGSLQVVRGGSYIDNTKKLRCTARDKSIPSMKSDNLGFRLVLIRGK